MKGGSNPFGIPYIPLGSVLANPMELDKKENVSTL
jgi:hypothetical protein